MLRVSGCCCCDLKTGGIVIGWFGLVGSILTLLNGLLNIRLMNIMIQITGDCVPSYEFAILAVVMVISAIELLINIGLLWGIRKEKRFFLLPWLIMRMISLVFYYLAVFGGSIALFVKSEIILGFVLLIGGLCLCALLTYFWICIQNLYVKFQEDGECDGLQQEDIGFIEHSKTIQTIVDCNLSYPPPHKNN